MADDELLGFFKGLALKNPHGEAGSSKPRRPGQPIQALAAKKILFAELPALIRIHDRFEATLGRLPVPSPEQFEEIAAGALEMPLEGHLAAIFDLVTFHLAEAIGQIQEHGHPTEATLKSGAPNLVLLGALGRLIRERSLPRD